MGILKQALHLEHMTLMWVRMVRMGRKNPNLVWGAIGGHNENSAHHRGNIWYGKLVNILKGPIGSVSPHEKDWAHPEHQLKARATWLISLTESVAEIAGTLQ